MINIKSLNIAIDEFKEKYWYGKKIEIPNFIKALNSDITEEQLFNKLASNIANTCDIFINQALSNGIGNLEQYKKIVDLIGISKITNFKCAVYTELKYRLANQIFPEFQQKQHYLPQQFSISGGRDFNSIRELLSFEAIAFLRLNDWAQINNSICDAKVDLLNKLSETNSELNKMINQNSTNIENNTQMLIQYGHKVDEIDLNTKANTEKLANIEEKTNANKSNLDNHIQSSKQTIEAIQVQNNEQNTKIESNTNKINSLGDLDKLYYLGYKFEVAFDNDIIKVKYANPAIIKEYNLKDIFENDTKVTPEQIQQIETNKSDLKAIKDKNYDLHIESINNRLEDHVIKIGTNSETLKTMSASVNQMLNEQSEKINSIKTNIESLNTNQIAQDSKISEIQKEERNNTERIRDLEAAVEVLKKSQAGGVPDLSDYVKKIEYNEFNNKLKELINKKMVLTHYINIDMSDASANQETNKINFIPHFFMGNLVDRDDNNKNVVTIAGSSTMPGKLEAKFEYESKEYTLSIEYDSNLIYTPVIKQGNNTVNENWVVSGIYFGWNLLDKI